MPPKPDPDRGGAASANPLAAAFVAVLADPYGSPNLTSALKAVLPHLVEAHRRGIPYAQIAEVLSQVSVAAGRAPVSEATLRGLVHRLRLRAAVIAPTAAVRGLATGQGREGRSKPPLEPTPVPAAPSSVPAKVIAPVPIGPTPSDPPAAPIRPDGGLSERALTLAQARRALRTT